MKLARRQLIHLAAGATVLPAASRLAQGQTYPARPVRVLEGFGPGGTPDIVARLVGQWLSERLGQSFVVENRTGAGGTIATEAGVRAPADGYTLLTVTTANAVDATFYDKLNYNFIRDTAPVASIMRTPFVMEVSPSFPATTAAEFIAYAKANPRRLNMASAGNGTSTHLSGELFKMMTGVILLTTCNERINYIIDWSVQAQCKLQERFRTSAPILAPLSSPWARRASATRTIALQRLSTRRRAIASACRRVTSRISASQ
jgi:tripartite-type tricarboxylate transporter receptor subunit TctC